MSGYRAVTNSAVLAEDRLSILRRVARKHVSSSGQSAVTATKKPAAKKTVAKAGKSVKKKAPAKA